MAAPTAGPPKEPTPPSSTITSGCTDMGAVHEGYVSLTPLHLDLTNHRALMQLGDWPDGLTAQLLGEAGRASRRAPAAAPARKPRRG